MMTGHFYQMDRKPREIVAIYAVITGQILRSLDTQFYIYTLSHGTLGDI